MFSTTTAARRSYGFAAASSGTLPTTFRSRARLTATKRTASWFNNEISSFDDSGPNNVYRERLALDHAQRLYGNVTDLTINSNIGGMENRFVTTVAASSQQFNVSQDTLFFSDTVNLINPDRGLYGPRSDEKIYPHLDKASLSFEDRLKVTSTFALIGGIRIEDIELARTRFSPTGVLRSDRSYPFSTTFNPVTGRVGYTSGSSSGDHVL